MNNEKRKFREITNYDLSKFGLLSSSPIMVKTIDDLRKNSHNIIIAEARKDLKFKQNDFQREHKLMKKENYVMSLGVYKQLHKINSLNMKFLKPSPLKFSNIYKPYNGENLDNKKILVWRHGGIGDLLFISPNLRYIKKTYPTSKIIFACGQQYRDMCKEWEFIDELIDLPFTTSRMFNVDYHVIFEGVIERTEEAKYVNAYELFSKWIGLNLQNEILVPEQRPNDDSLNKCKEILKQWNIDEKSFILIQPRASSPIRSPRPSIWKNVIDSLVSKYNCNVLITDSPGNEKGVDLFISTLSNKDKVYNFSKYSETIAETIAMTSLSKVVIGIDSSLIHIAESLKIPSVGIFGPFPGNIRLGTYKYCEWIDIKTECSPCFIHGNGLCKNSKYGYVSCYDNLNIDELVERVGKYV